jgi:hypothetical protein
MKTKTVQVTDFTDIDSLKAGDKIKLFCDSSVDEMTRFLKLKTGDDNEFIDYIYFAMQHHNHTVISEFLINAGVLTEAEIVFRSKGDILVISFFDQIEKVDREMAISPVELFEKFWIFKEVEEEDVVAVIAGVDRETGEDVEFEVKKGMACASVSVSEALGTLAVVCGKVISVSDSVVRMETAAGAAMSPNAK